MSSATTERWLALMAVIAAAVVPRRAPRPPRGRSRMMCGTAPRPAFSMRAAPGIPSVSMARRSSRRISSALRTGSTSVRQGGGLGEKVGEDRRVDLASLDAGRLRQFDVQCLGGQTKNADALGAARPIHHGVGRLDEHVEALTAGAGAKMRVANELEQCLEAKRVVAVGAHGRDLDPLGGLATIVAVNLHVEGERALGH